MNINIHVYGNFLKLEEFITMFDDWNECLETPSQQKKKRSSILEVVQVSITPRREKPRYVGKTQIMSDLGASSSDRKRKKETPVHT
jgi:hypothetical protein